MRILETLPLSKLTEFKFLMQQLEERGLFNLSEARKAVEDEDKRRHQKEKIIRGKRQFIKEQNHIPLRSCKECGAPMTLVVLDEENEKIIIADCINKRHCWFSEILPVSEYKKYGINI